jgi:Ca2+-binding RTX toxin-like protein
MSSLRPFEGLETRSVPAALTATLSNLGVLRVTGTTGADDIVVRQQDGVIWIEDTDIVSSSGSSEAVSASTVKKVEVIGLAGDDVIDLSSPDQDLLARSYVHAGAGNDWIRGGNGNDTILGWSGNDLIFGDDGADAIYGQTGNDFLDDGSRTVNEIAQGGLGFDWNADVVAVQGFRATDVRQRNSPTCSFLASLSGLASINYDFREWISYGGLNSSGMPSYSVAFWNGTDWTWQSVEFTGKLLASDTSPSAEGESWVVLMHRGWQAFRGDDGEAFPHEAILALTGAPATHAEYVDEMMTNADLESIIDTLNQGGIVVAGTGPDSFLATQTLIAEHAYTVEDVLLYNGKPWLVLRNPMGFDGGNEVSGNTRDGLLYVSWIEFRQSMVYLSAF